MDGRMVLGYTMLAGGVILWTAASAYAGYKYAEKRTIEKYDEQLQEEIAATKKYYSKMNKKEEYDDPVNVAVGIVYAEGYSPEEASEDDEEESGPAPKVEDPGGLRRDPYVISLEAFLENPTDHDQQSLTYFEGDDVLVDEHNVPIEDIDSLIGLASLDQFGHRSKNQDIVYVRNEWISMDLEVTRQHSSFERMFAGEIRHSDRRIRKFKIADE